MGIRIACANGARMSSYSLRQPERFRCGHKVHGHLFYETAEPEGAFFHTRLLGRDVPQNDQRFVSTSSDGISDIFHRLPFRRFADQQRFYIIALKHADLPF